MLLILRDICAVSKKIGVCGEFDHYRSISLICLHVKVFKICLNARFIEKIKLNILQFGCGGCLKVLFALRSTVEYFTEYMTALYIYSIIRRE